ncbi:TIGR03619 family F420-dependent LLM class oxidoreductase [Amycolatopsis cihanbeyliensis]|uniref:Putative F420-dependent oxidoreductase n=1 Tax=Amycolatopsis cihanbeyliensis TaxID=1128664 RepID=A0A542DR27_AMYCI|nr:TIGR03619 family F420-dependent LLM class oxidoreductase [Amycolatopsis cihanbeyliensis]TQJ05506.1 putative F420-dependent oxidoreductase [Amycolatopsis cihanbeyliensis]
MPDKQLPRVGVSLPSFGPHTSAEAIVTVAVAADRLGFHAVSATERLLLPAGPDWCNEMGLPEYDVWDIVEVLTWASAHTRRVRLATGVVNALFQPPVVLARRLATLDQLSGGRLDAGIGQGWLPEEFTAVGVPLSRRGAGFEDYLAALRACWGPDPVEHEGPRYRIPSSRVGPKPVHGIPVRIGAVARPAVERAARLGDGFVTGVRDWESSAAQIAWYRAAGGTGPVVAQLMSEWAVEDPDEPVSAFARRAVTDLEQAAAAGVDELHWGFTMSGVPPHRQAAALEALAISLPPTKRTESGRNGS